jgi:hypothetical protein
MLRFFIFAAAAANTIQHTDAFSPAAQRIQFYSKQRATSSTLQMCICIHCKHVTNCLAYHFVEEQHRQPHMNNDPTWEPRDGSPTIDVTIRKGRGIGGQLAKMEEEHEEETRKAEEAFLQENNGELTEDITLHGETKYDVSGAVEYEFDVVACEDFVEERDKWVKNMPEEIRLANPDFVPT